MKGQPISRANDTDIIRLISDNQGITTEELSKKCGIARKTVQQKIDRLARETRVFRQKKQGGNGCTNLLYTYSYARNHHVPLVYPEKPEKTTVELQMMFHSLIRGYPVV